MKAALFIGLAICSTVASAAEPSVTFSLDFEKSQGPTNELRFSAPEKHHFNEQAPQKVLFKSGGQWTPAQKIETSGRKLSAHWEKKYDPCEGVKALLYVCDDNNTYCVPHATEFQCDNGKIAANDIDASQFTATKSGTGRSSVPEDKSFIDGDWEAALKKAKDEHKPLLIDFYGIWCPPCNQLDETVFSSPEFDKLRTRLVLLKLDADQPASWTLKSKYRVQGYPTVIFANEDGDEVSRVVGSRDKNYFIGEMKKFLKNKDNSFEKKKALAEKKDGSTAAYEVGLTYLDRGEYPQAHYYLTIASRSWRLADIKHNKLMSAELGMHSDPQNEDDKIIYEKFLQKALDWYPRQPEVFDRADELSKVAAELGDKETANKAHENQIETARWFLSHPKATKMTEYTSGDLWEIIADAYDQMEDKRASENAYAKAADVYLSEINKAKLDPQTERGYNLERVWCIWKSGQRDVAEKLYENLEKIYPTEFTFFFQHARLLNTDKDYGRAEEKAKKALEYSYGDNKLRATAVLAEIYKGKAEKKKALDVLDKTLDHYALPEDKTIRTHRYYNKLVQLRKDLK